MCRLKICQLVGLSSLITKLFHNRLPSYSPPMMRNTASIMSAPEPAVLY